jgi:hypothetical protein
MLKLHLTIKVMIIQLQLSKAHFSGVIILEHVWMQSCDLTRHLTQFWPDPFTSGLGDVFHLNLQSALMLHRYFVDPSFICATTQLLCRSRDFSKQQIVFIGFSDCKCIVAVCP